METSTDYIRRNFDFLVSKYAGKYIGVINENIIAAALTPKEVLESAKVMGGDEEKLSILKVPTSDELLCVL